MLEDMLAPAADLPLLAERWSVTLGTFIRRHLSTLEACLVVP